MPTRTQRTAQRPPRGRASARLSRYNAKRDLTASGEPPGGSERPSEGAVRRFVIQKHDATRLHYDFRLEMDGVYRSWAVPKGLPTEPGERSLAVEVEDHPLEYGNFEGIIPAGNYGGGTVMLWDRGHYTVSGPSPEQVYRQGKIHLALAGEKCVGEWTLVRMHPRPGEKHTNWLVIKNSTPAHEAPMTGAERDLSVLSGRSLEQIASGEPAAAAKRAERSRPPKDADGRAAHSRIPKSTGRVGGVPSPREESVPNRKRGAGTPPTARAAAHRRRRESPPTAGSAATTEARAGGARSKSGGSRRRTREPRVPTAEKGERLNISKSREHLPPAEFIPPMKALNIDAIPAGKWRLEVKFDGYRAIAVINHGEVELWSRNRKRMTDQYPEVVAALKTLPCTNAVVDGEIVALDEQGHSRFQLLQNAGAANHAPVVYYAFDLLHHDGRSLLERPIEERQIALEVMIGKRDDALRFSAVFEVAPEKLLAEVRRKGLEGIIAKTPGSVYEPDRRSGTWLKCKVHGEQEFVIGGFTPPKNSREGFGAILVGYYRDGELRYAGKVGSGFDRAQLASLHREFLKRRTNACPFTDLPAARRSRFGTGMTRSAMKEVTWIKPELVAQVQFTEWTEDGSLRHPVFLGLRDDKRAVEVVREG